MPDWTNSAVPERFSLWTMPGSPMQDMLGQPWTSQSNNWITNQALYIPFLLPWRYPIRRAFWGNGGAASGHIDIGMYSINGARLWSLGSGVSQGSGFSVGYGSLATPVIVSPGRYYLAMSIDNSTSQISGANPGPGVFRAFGWYQQASAYPLPAQASFSPWTASLPVGVFGLMASASGI